MVKIDEKWHLTGVCRLIRVRLVDISVFGSGRGPNPVKGQVGSGGTVIKVDLTSGLS